VSENSDELHRLAAKWFGEMDLSSLEWTFEVDGSCMVLTVKSGKAELVLPERLEHRMDLIVEISTGRISVPVHSNLPPRTEFRIIGGAVTLGSEGPEELRVTGGTEGVLLVKGTLRSPVFDAFGGVLKLDVGSEILGAEGIVKVLSLPNREESEAQLGGDEANGLAIERLSMDSGKEPAVK
jgi:hypothetical protein